MKCVKCGTELPVGSIICAKCGAEIEDESGEVKIENETKEIKNDSKSINIWENFKTRICQEWGKLSLFSKVMTIAIAICVLVCCISFACGKVIAGIIGITQICLLVVGCLMQKRIIKTQKSHIYVILLVIAFALYIPCISLMFSPKDANTDFSDVSNSSNMESIEVLNDFVWPEGELAELLPIPKSSKGYIMYENTDEISIYVGETTKDDYIAYREECVDKGFATITSEGDGFYNANNERGYRLALSYQEEQAMVICVEEPLYTVQLEFGCEENLFFNKYDVIVYVDDEQVGTLEHGATEVFEKDLEKGKYTILVVSEEEESVDGTVTVDVSESTKFVYSIHCEGEQINITEEYIETLGTLEDGQIKIPQSSEEYGSSIYADVVNELKSVGFTNIKENVIRDLTGGWFDTDGEIEEISVDGRTDFKKAEVFDSDVEIVITYHTFELSSEEMSDLIADKNGKNASDILKLFEGTGYKVIYYVCGELIDDFSPEGYIFEDGWLETDEKVAHLNFTTKELQAMMIQLEETFPQENAKRASVVAMTNSQATDVFNSDGNTYDITKFHSYSDISGFYLTVINEGSWKAVDDHTWHVDGLTCMMSETGTYLKASLDVSFDGNDYTVSKVDKVIATEEYIDSDDSSKINAEHLEPTENTPYLIVQHSMIEEDRDSVVEQEQNNKTIPTDERTEWIESQFSLWDGAHTELEKLIKKSLNDEKSYKHIETTYIDVVNEENRTRVNDVISSMGYKVEIGDLFVITEFSAKNAFNATIKSTAYGIVSYDDNAVRLIGIE